MKKKEPDSRINKYFGKNTDKSFNRVVCPSCGFIMQARRGKLICFNCGYFESCCGG